MGRLAWEAPLEPLYAQRARKRADDARTSKKRDGSHLERTEVGAWKHEDYSSGLLRFR